MAKSLQDKVIIVTGAGRGIGREIALLCAAEGAKVVVNDLGGSVSGEGASGGPAQQVVDEIVAAGGEAVANTDDIADYDGAGRLIQTAVDTFGRLDAVVCNAGILRDRMLVNMTVEEWDAVIAVLEQCAVAVHGVERGHEVFHELVGELVGRRERVVSVC